MLNLSRLAVKYRQSVNSRVSSFPYLSGDTFKSVADFSYEVLADFHSNRSWGDVKVVFCKSDKVEEFKSEKPNALNPQILLCGNSDFDFYEFNIDCLQNVRAIFLQNSFISDNKRFFTLPIGLENAKYASNGRIKFYSKELVHSKVNAVLVGPFGATHDERKQLSNFPHDSSLHYVEDRISIKRHLKNLDFYSYVACPRGNGVDTQRAWEAMYRGSVPILRKNAGSQSILDFGFPVKLVDSWSEISSVTNEMKNFNPSGVRNNSYLWMREWEKLFSKFI